MKFHKITVHASSLGVEFIQGVLMGAEAECFEIIDPTDLQELLDTQYVPFDYVDDALLETKDDEPMVRVYLADNSQGREKMEFILEGIEALRNETEFDLGSLKTEISETDDSEWADNWKEFFHPLPIGNSFVVKPTWEDWEGEDRIVLEIDPESSFGSGQHETTSLCLEALEDISLEGVSVLDMGCGSGILGIGALLLGAKDVLAVDIDKNAVDIAVKNANLNKVENFEGLCGNTLADQSVYEKVTSKKYGVILANIVADVIIAMAPTFKKVLEDDGILICSGIISPRKGEVLTSLAENGFALTGIGEKNDWVAITCTKA
ncbi:MAG: 50S ribosomal protein L11 methyltransferase [Clostridia bacterium]|nr:50S ribosomal protein L11 methyltransferase [Clostridia bacterium]MBO7246523.1 50S ribosomal protein L11 methyltransferase [Clostridia bacterium]